MEVIPLDVFAMNFPPPPCDPFRRVCFFFLRPVFARPYLAGDEDAILAIFFLLQWAGPFFYHGLALFGILDLGLRVLFSSRPFLGIQQV